MRGGVLTMGYFIVSAIALGGAWYMLKDVPGGIVRKHTPKVFHSKRRGFL